MLAMSNICKNGCYLMTQVRWKSKTHWAKLRRKNSVKDKAMAHFDDFYGSVFGKEWQPIKEALLRRSKYVAVVNNYADTEQTMEYLIKRGAHCLKNLYNVQSEHNRQYSPMKMENVEEPNSRVEDYVSKLQSDEISNMYSQSDQAPHKLETPDVTLHSGDNDEVKTSKEVSQQPNKTLDQSIADAVIDESRIIDPSLGVTSASLYQYVPATKLKGMDEWLPESLHYSYYSKGKDFPLTIEPETSFTFPEHLKVYTFEMDSEDTTFPEPKRGQTGVYNYYPMDCGSVLTVLALGITAGDRILDLCAAPGGKSLVALQTLLPDVIVCNDISISRSNRIQRIFRDYLFDFTTSNRWRERVVCSRVDGRLLVDDQGYDKVLVDVPCTTDRHSVMEEENNIFRPDRVKERLKIPEMQADLLANGLRLARVGGTVVYSTCSLSPIQNDGVLHMALKHVFETYGIVAVVKDLSVPMSGFTSTVHVATGKAAPKYGQLVLPGVSANYGPTYFAKLVRVK